MEILSLIWPNFKVALFFPTRCLIFLDRQPLLGNVSFTKGVRRFLYAVTPKEASFAKLDDVPDYLNEVSTGIK